MNAGAERLRVVALVALASGLICLAFATTGCSSASAPADAPRAVASLSVALSFPASCLGDTVKASMVAYDANHGVMTGQVPVWSSSDPRIATVDATGLVHAMAAGKTRIRATVGSVTGDVGFVGREPAISFSNTFPSLFVGDTTQLVAAAADSAGPGLPSSWSSLAPAVATVAADGVVTGRLAGVAEIVAGGACGSHSSVFVVVLTAPGAVNREIVYISDTAITPSLNRARLRSSFADGSNVRDLGAAGQSVSRFWISPDGTRILVSYIAQDSGTRAGYWVQNFDGSGDNQLGIDSQGLVEPNWSPDAARIAFRQLGAVLFTDDVYTMAADGTDLRRITSAPYNYGAPKWSPDGRQVMYARWFDQTAPEMWLVAADSSHRRKVALPTPAFDTQWSPDGKAIAYDNRADVWIVNADGSNSRALTQYCPAFPSCATGDAAFSPSWSPDGRHIAFIRRVGGTSSLVIAKADGTNPIVVPLAMQCCAYDRPRWSPDGALIAFAAVRNPGAPIFTSVGVIGTDGSGLRWVSGPKFASSPAWRR